MTALAADLAELALGIAQEAGALLLARRGDARAVATKSSAHDLVTQMDRESEALVRARITAARPDDVVLGEEGGSVGAAGSGVRWIVDPLDGTVNYFYGLPAWAVSIGVEIDGVIRAGAVVAPALGEQYVGAEGAGSWAVEPAGRVRLAVSEVAELADALVSTGFGYLRERRVRQGDIVAALVGEVRDIRRVGAAAIDLCWVARGRLDAHYERGLADWDRAAGGLIAREAGATVAGLGGRPDTPDLTIAANTELFSQLADRLTTLGADSGP